MRVVSLVRCTQALLIDDVNDHGIRWLDGPMRPIDRLLLTKTSPHVVQKRLHSRSALRITSKKGLQHFINIITVQWRPNGSRAGNKTVLVPCKSIDHTP